MKSYLLSVLVRMYRGLDLEAFRRAHPDDWLLWEPGTWRPPSARTVIIPPSAPQVQPSAGEALAFSLAAQPQLTLGRGTTCDVVINDGTLSQMHLVLERADDGWLVRDAGSRNGSWLDGVALGPGMERRLRAGARLKAGQVALTYYDPQHMHQRLQTAG